MCDGPWVSVHARGDLKGDGERDVGMLGRAHEGSAAAARAPPGLRGPHISEATKTLATEKKEANMANEIASSDFIILGDESRRLAELLETNHGGAQLTAADCERLTIPTGGILHFTLQTPSGDEPHRVIGGIIIHAQYRRAHWRERFDQRSTSQGPDCASSDGITGVGDPGGVCASCPYSSFTNDEAPACRAFIDLFFLLPGELFPTVLPVARGSIKAVRKYLFALTKRGLCYYHVVTELSLERATNRHGIVFSRLVLKQVRLLDEWERGRATEVVAALRRVLTGRGAGTEDE